jgi:capsular exopolysaccharide synthesis family protein
MADFLPPANALIPPTDIPRVGPLYPPAPAGPVITLGPMHAGGGGAADDPSQNGISLSRYLWILNRHRWRILAFVLVCLVATLAVSLRLSPVYESTATVDIDRQSAPGIIGQDAARSMLNDADQFLATQVRLIQSDSVLRPVVRKYNLKADLQAPPAGTPQAEAEEAPVVLRRLKVARPPNTYLLQIGYRSTDPRLAADVANAIAQSYIEHTYSLRFRASSSLSAFMEKQLEELKAKMERSTSALAQFERELNVINPEEKTSILSSRLLQLNTEYTQAQADRVRKQAASVSLGAGSLEAAQVSAQGESLRKLGERLNETRERFAQVKSQYGSAHPEYRKAAAQLAELESLLEKSRENIAGRVAVEYREAVNREEMLRKAVGETKAEFDRLNARSFEYQQLKREAEADKKIYDELVRRIKEAGINASFQNSSIRLADAARAAVLPVFPNLKLNLALALVLSLLLSITVAVLFDLVDTTVRDPDQVARTLNTPVVGTLPAVGNWRKRWNPIPLKHGGLMVSPANGKDDSANGFAESIRTLRNSILLADFDRRVRSILVTSASPSEGKSTTAAYLALSHAEQGRRTLIIDGDLRRPSLHRRFGIPSDRGLSNVMLRETGWRDVVVALAETENLHILPAGPPSRRAADLVGANLLEVIEQATREYDLVVLDAPPLLGFAETLQMATGADGVLVVARAGATNRKALAVVVGTLLRLRANLLGLVLNEVRRDIGDSYYYHSYYGKYYRAQES